MTPPDDTAASPWVPFEIPRALVEFILVGRGEEYRQLRDSPILGDVWVEFGRSPGQRLELLITPCKGQAAGTVASVLTGDRSLIDGEIVDFPRPTLQRETENNVPLGLANIAFLQGIVAAYFTFAEVLQYVVPMTSWWRDKRFRLRAFFEYQAPIEEGIDKILEAAILWHSSDESLRDLSREIMPNQEAGIRFLALAGLILWAEHPPAGARPPADASPHDRIRQIVKAANGKTLFESFKKNFSINDNREPKDPLVETISLNRRTSHAMIRSVPAVKGDAASSLFKVNCSRITWAVFDSGIDASHPAFLDTNGHCRVVRILDFTRIRDIITLDNLRDTQRRKQRVTTLLQASLKRPLDVGEATSRLEALAKGAKDGRTVNWELARPFIEMGLTTPPTLTGHGTHVAGIIGASADAVRAQAKRETERRTQEAMAVGRNPPPTVQPPSDIADGMCPDIKLCDVRVIGGNIRETEFAIIAAIQYVRHLNDLYNSITIHGANLSLSIPHDVRNYACGRTPICNECERLINSGVVVVAAAGNRGYQAFDTTDGIYESYASLSLTDPGNADGVITVGATHPSGPHTYGVSFFSSRGPTGDGRIKPDLVAPGEQILSTFPRSEWGILEGTSMAAAHVSGAAAMLMARYSELVGQPRQIKSILCKTATDLGRERTFQGHGMLDVLRAFQSL